MNTEYVNYCFKSIKRRLKSVTRTSLAVFLVFVFVAWVMLFKSDMYEWQMQSAKQRFGNWFVMMYGSDNKENSELKGHPYLDNSGKAGVVNYVYDNNDEKSDIKIGYMSDEFIKIGNIRADKGHFPQSNDEAALDWNTLISLNQGTELGQDISIKTAIKNSSGDTDIITKTYKLCGILDSYTNVWTGGNNVPGIIVTQQEAADIKQNGDAVYIYSANSNYVENNYRDIYEGIKKKAGALLEYNSSVYDYEPWAGNFIYDYMYIVLAAIGIAAIAYQLTVYNRQRKNVYTILKGLGARRVQLIGKAFIENSVIVICSSLAGLIFSIISARLVCLIVEIVSGVSFFSIDKEVYISLVIMLAAAVIAGLFVSIYMPERKEKNKKTYKSAKHKAKQTINKNNYINQTYKRLKDCQPLIQRVSLRIFSLAMMIIMAGCVAGIIVTYKDYKAGTDDVDIVGFKQEDKNAAYIMNYCWDITEPYPSLYSNDTRGFYKNYYSHTFVTPMWEEYYKRDISSYSENLLSNGQIKRRIYSNHTELLYNIKRADALMYKGIDESIISYLNNISGVKEINYGYFDTARVWHWDNMNYNKMGIAWYVQDSQNKHITTNANPEDTDRYLFATEYVKPDSKIYDILCEYAGKDKLSYDEFANGDKCVVFLNKNIEGEYDDTITEGTKIGLMGYSTYPPAVGEGEVKERYTGSYYKAVKNYMNNVGPQLDDYYDSRSVLYEIMEKYTYNRDFVPAAESEAACVIYVDDEVKESLKEYIPEFGLYTMIVSDETGKKAVDTQNEWLKEYLTADKLPDELTLSMKYNQVNIRYSLNSVYNGTANTVASYLGQAGFSYSSYSEPKDVLRSNTMEAFILYGFTLVTAALSYIVVIMLVLRNTMSEYRSRIMILRSTGADKDVIFKVYMTMCIRESLWCIILAPVVLILEAVCLKLGLKRV